MTFEERLEFLCQSIESHDRQIGETASLVAQNGRDIADLKDAISKLVTVSNADATAIQALARNQA